MAYTVSSDQELPPPDRFRPPASVLHDQGCICFRGEFDEEGVYVYQAYGDAVADWALEHGSFGGPSWKPDRMTWIKPSFAWMLYRSGYGRKIGQTRILKMKLSHASLAYLLQHCECVHNSEKIEKAKKKEPCNTGRIQWDPERELFQAEQKQPRRMARQRSIQIGLSGTLSQFYVKHTISILEVTDLAHQVERAHCANDVQSAMKALTTRLPNEQPYMPDLPPDKLRDLGMLPGDTANSVKSMASSRSRQGSRRPAGKANC